MKATKELYIRIARELQKAGYLEENDGIKEIDAEIEFDNFFFVIEMVQYGTITTDPGDYYTPPYSEFSAEYKVYKLEWYNTDTDEQYTDIDARELEKYL